MSRSQLQHVNVVIYRFNIINSNVISSMVVVYDRITDGKREPNIICLPRNSTIFNSIQIHQKPEIV